MHIFIQTRLAILFNRQEAMKLIEPMHQAHKTQAKHTYSHTYRPKNTYEIGFTMLLADES